MTTPFRAPTQLLLATSVVLALLGCTEEEIDAGSCSAADEAALDGDIDEVFEQLVDDGSPRDEQVSAACDDSLGPDYLTEECTSSPGNEECETVVGQPLPTSTPEEAALQEACVALYDTMLDRGCFI